MHTQMETTFFDKTDRHNLTQTVFPHPTTQQRKIVIKENTVSPKKVGTVPPSPQKNVVYHRSPLRNNPSRCNVFQKMAIPAQQMTVASERENQLVRKIKVLEGRIQELHQEKQMGVIKFHE